MDDSCAILDSRMPAEPEYCGDYNSGSYVDCIIDYSDQEYAILISFYSVLILAFIILRSSIPQNVTMGDGTMYGNCTAVDGQLCEDGEAAVEFCCAPMSF